jgi:hypothetical protein
MGAYLLMTRNGQKTGCFATAAAQIAVRREAGGALSLPMVSVGADGVPAELLAVYDLDVEGVSPIGTVGADALLRVELQGAEDLPDELPDQRNRSERLTWVNPAQFEEALAGVPDLLQAVMAAL